MEKKYTVFQLLSAFALISLNPYAFASERDIFSLARTLSLPSSGSTELFKQESLSENAVDSDSQATIDMLIRKFAPLVKLHKTEIYLPSSVSWFVERTKLMNDDSVELEHPTLNNLATHLGEHYYLQMIGNKNAVRQTRFGEPLDQGFSHAPCYAHWVYKPQGAVIQYLFFYPYNGTLFQPLEHLEGKVPLNLGNHDGDWEHIDVHLLRKGNEYIAQKAYYARHTFNKYGSFSSADDIEWVEGTHPTVYSAYYGHASYAHPFHGVNSALDRTSAKGGAQWRCWENSVDIGSLDQPTSGQEWIRFQGRWGKDGSFTGSQQEWWRITADQKYLMMTLDLNFDKKQNSNVFDLKGQIPTRVNHLFWKIEHPHAKFMTLSVYHKALFRNKPVFENLEGEGAETPIPDKKTKLYIQLKSMEDWVGTGPAQLTIWGVEE